MESFLDMFSDEQTAGGGTVCLRPHTYRGTGEDQSRVRSAGIPTGWSTETQGFRKLDLYHSKHVIDLAVERIVVLLQNNPARDCIVYSCDATDESLVGTNIFTDSIGADVVQYISALVHNIPKRVGKSTYSHDRITNLELRQSMYAVAVHDAAKLRAEVVRLKGKLKLKPGSGSITRHGQSSLLRLPKASQPTGASSSGASKPLQLKPVGASGPVPKAIFKQQLWLKE